MTWTIQLMAWYKIHKRSFPWRKSRDPYKIWLSEIILQQTRIAQGTPYYQSFIENFPTVENSSRDTLLPVFYRKLSHG